MATDEERAQARRLLEIHQKNLNELQVRAAKHGGDVPLYIVNQMDEEQANIALLTPIAKPAPSASIQAFVSRVSNNNGGDWAMLFSQVVLLNTRMTKQEDETAKIRQNQSDAAIWRLAAGEDIKALQADRADRIRGQRRNFILLLSIVGMLVLLVAFVVWRLG
jgi:hypothetical protein